MNLLDADERSSNVLVGVFPGHRVSEDHQRERSLQDFGFSFMANQPVVPTNNYMLPF